MECKVCNGVSNFFFNTIVLQKYKVDYFKCSKCSFVQTEEPYWLDEAYSNVITKLDVGLIYRNLNFSNVVDEILKKYFNPKKTFLDYGGGYGIFVRMMRDKGFDFYRCDKYCQNIFAEYFDISDLITHDRFEVVTAFEVFEHLVNPLTELSKLLDFSDNIIFSTEVQPHNFCNQNDWWYVAPETGQHISLFSYDSLIELSKRFNMNFYSNKSSLHILTKSELTADPFQKDKKLLFDIFRNKKKSVDLESLLMKDFEHVKSKLHFNN